MKPSSPQPAMNFVAAELSALLEKEDIEEGGHIPGKINVHADYLSRPPLVSPPPLGPEEVTIKKITKLLSLSLPGPCSRPDLWGREQAGAEQNRPESSALHRDTLPPRSWQ